MSAMEGEVFVPNGDSRQNTAILLVGTAKEYGIDVRKVRATALGFYVPQELRDIVSGNSDDKGDESEDYFDPADYTVAQVQEFVTDYPETVEDILASEQDGKNRTTLIEWLTEYTKTSGNRAAKTGTDKE